MIEINNLKKNYGETVACNIEHFTVNDGEMLGLVGNNGAGKTTLFRMLLDLIKPDEGIVLLNGTNPAESEAWKDTTGAFVDQSFLIDFLTPEEYFLFVGKTSGLNKEQVMERLSEFEAFMAGEILGKNKLIRNLSAGNQQKVGIVAAMLHRPTLLILDEPFNFLDPSSQNHLKRMLSDYNAATGASIIVSSHNLEHTINICKRIALLEHGVILRDIDNYQESARTELENYFA